LITSVSTTIADLPGGVAGAASTHQLPSPIPSLTHAIGLESPECSALRDRRV